MKQLEFLAQYEMESASTCALVAKYFVETVCPVDTHHTNHRKEDAIVEKEKAASELKRKYFGPEGELFKKREELMKPIQDEIYNAVKAVAEENGYAVVVDRASASSIIFATPRIDVSNEVLAKLGYSN